MLERFKITNNYKKFSTSQQCIHQCDTLHRPINLKYYKEHLTLSRFFPCDSLSHPFPYCPLYFYVLMHLNSFLHTFAFPFVLAPWSCTILTIIINVAVRVFLVTIVVVPVFLYLVLFFVFFCTSLLLLLQWRRNRSGWSGFGRTTFHGEKLKLTLIFNN